MGTRCSCGMIVDATKNDVNVKFNGINGNVKGTLSYIANVCADTLDTSTLTLTFVSNVGQPATSFTFQVGPSVTGTSFSSVTCSKDGNTCVITVSGTGQVTGYGGPAFKTFTGEFRDGVANDHVESFAITNFFAQTGSEVFSNGSIQALGCS